MSQAPFELCSVDRRLDMMRALRGEWASCNRCQLARYRKQVVFGGGAVSARLMLVGTGPGEEEDLEGKPFIGRSGVILDKLMRIVGLDRSSLFITNVVGCRPPDNRDPYPDEIDACWPRLCQQVYIADPLVIVSVGAIATNTLLRKRVKIQDAMGRLYTCTIPGRTDEVLLEYPVIPLVHPAFLLRNFDTTRGGPVHRAAQALWDAMYLADTLATNYFGDKVPPRKERP